MDETEKMEDEAYRKNLETLVTARTEQLRQAASQNDQLLEFLKRIQLMESLEEIHEAVRVEVDKLESQRPTPPQFGGKPGEPVPEVDPDDLKNLWQLQRETELKAIDMEVTKHCCKPGANIEAVYYRATFLWMLNQIMPLMPEQFAAFIKDGQGTEAAFRAAAKVPAEWMGVGVVRHSPPFDVNEFIRLCEEHRGGA